MSKIQDNEMQEIISLHKKGFSAEAIAKIVHHSKDGVCKALNRSGYCTSRNIFSRLTATQIEDICQMYIKKVPTSKIVEKYSCFFKTQNTVLKIVKANGITPRPSGFAPIIAHEDFFNVIDNEEKAYVLGLMISDGYVVRTKGSPIWGITLHKEDKYLLETIKVLVGSDKKISEERNEAVFSVTSTQMVQDLSKYGVVPQKSFLTYYPTIPNIFNRHLIRGIFDGDGCISNGICSFYGNTPLLVGIQETISKEANIQTGKITIREVNGANSFSFGAKDKVKSFYHYIYDDSTIWLKRKKDKFEDLQYITKC